VFTDNPAHVHVEVRLKAVELCVQVTSQTECDSCKTALLPQRKDVHLSRTFDCSGML
jgi:hypothetical protein